MKTIRTPLEDCYIVQYQRAENTPWQTKASWQSEALASEDYETRRKIVNDCRWRLIYQRRELVCESDASWDEER